MTLYQETGNAVLMVQILLHNLAVSLRYETRVICAHVCDKARIIRNAKTLLLQWLVAHAFHVAESPAGVEHHRNDVVTCRFRHKEFVSIPVNEVPCLLEPIAAVTLCGLFAGKREIRRGVRNMKNKVVVHIVAAMLAEQAKLSEKRAKSSESSPSESKSKENEELLSREMEEISALQDEYDALSIKESDCSSRYWNLKHRLDEMAEAPFKDTIPIRKEIENVEKEWHETSKMKSDASARLNDAKIKAAKIQQSIRKEVSSDGRPPLRTQVPHLANNIRSEPEHTLPAASYGAPGQY